MTFLVAALAVWALSPASERRPLGLMGTLPIYWGEAAGVEELIAGNADPHWARAVLEQDYELVPLDTLAGAAGLGSPEAVGRALLAQPRPLSGAENVALDDWVRGGGHLLLFADPMLTGHSRFPIGDRRRPQDVILLSPILSRWGLELQFDPQQDDDERTVAFEGTELPMRLPGNFRIVGTSPGAPANCELAANGVIADCTIGSGRVLIVADAAILEQDAEDPRRKRGLQVLADRAFADS
ncbi:ABC transporter [Allopontixanthobacter sp.]|uniref:ABC transporter n=1 Tax=Allopontixanthobacter sp. TaxID=2906452 RepID=UPI002ABC083B|nr:ABC transporter [Allopontixanthobacter sp.]MDZ4307392.1 ABC transporter [Allopontixanthobacter sp.]